LIAQYLEKFVKLRVDAAHQWPTETTNRAPHKPFLLLSIVDLFAQGNIRSNRLELCTELIDLFNEYWTLVMPTGTRGSVALPFFHMKSEGFWHLAPLPGKEHILSSTRQMRSILQLNETVSFVSLDEDLYQLLCVAEQRALLRTALIETYFAPDIQAIVAEQGSVNVEAFHYSKALLERRRQDLIKEGSDESANYLPKVRDQGFRRAIVSAYEHRCALCGIRMRTPEGYTVVDAAHIIPWSVSQDDDPRNGIALCRLCHWSFDTGLVTVSEKYNVLTSALLNVDENMPGHLITMNGRAIVGPIEASLWPAIDALNWHRKNIFRKK